MRNEDSIAYYFNNHDFDAEAQANDKGLVEAIQHAAPIRDIKNLGCFAKRYTGEVVGGCVGRTWGRCCELQQLWVMEEYRRQGIGTRLVRMFEERACSHGCRILYLETFSFQAPDLYRSLGYEIKLEIVGFPDGISKCILTKIIE